MAHNYTNTASKAVLDSPINSSVGTITLTGFSGYPSVPFFALVDRDTSAAELVEVTAVAGSSLTVTRGVGGTASTSHSAGATLEHVIPAAVPQAVEQHVEATSNIHGVTGGLVGADSPGTLTSKTYRGAHVHTYSDSLPDSPAAGFLVSADNSVSRDGFVANNTGANADRSGVVVRQSGSDRINLFYDGTVRVTPSGSAVRPAIQTEGTVQAGTLAVDNSATVGGDLTVTGNATATNGNFGNLNISGNLSSTGQNALGTVNAAGKITGNASGTGMTITNAAEVGTLSVTSGNATLLGTDARIQFPPTPTALPSGAGVGQVRYHEKVLEVHNGTNWFRPGSCTGFGTETTGYSTGTIPDGSAHPIFICPYFGNPSGAPYYLMCQGQIEINNVSDGGTRFDLTARLDAADGPIITVGLGNGFTQTGFAFTPRLTGDHSIYWVVQRTVGSGSCLVTGFNGQFTTMLVGSTAVS